MAKSGKSGISVGRNTKPPELDKKNETTFSRGTANILDLLKPSHRLFVLAYTGPALFNGVKAVEIAMGASCTTYHSRGSAACLLLKRKDVTRAVNAVLRNAFDTSDLSIDKVLRDLELQRIGAIGDRNWNAANHASELQGKYLKMFVDRIEHFQTIDETSTEEITTLLAEVLGKLDNVTIDQIFEGAGRIAAGSSSDKTTQGPSTAH